MWEGEVWWVIERGGGKEEGGEDSGKKMFCRSHSQNTFLIFDFLLSFALL